jgi:tetratricopeptide (TPR) repeat protein
MKLQTPNSKLQGSSKLQPSKIGRLLGVWGLKFIWSLVFGIWSFAPSAFADAPPAFREAAVLYDQGQFDQAAAHYESLLAAGVRSANLYFNLGNAHFKAGHLGRAILNYERARQLAPRDQDVDGNLNFAAKQSKAFDATAAGSWSVWLVNLRDGLTTGEWTWLTVTNYWLALLGVIALVWLPPSIEWRHRLRSAAIAFGAVALLASVGLGARIVMDEGPPPAITLAKEVVVRLAPLGDGIRHYTAYEGQKLWIIGEHPSQMQGVPGWFEVERADGQRGWVPADAIEKI